MTAAPHIEIGSRVELAAWLRDNHDRSGSIWLVTWKAEARDKYVPYAEIVEEAIAWGWIDSLPRALDEHRTMRRLSPRRRGSAWSANNKRIAERLISEGRIMPSGLAAIERAKADGSWAALDHVETLAVPEDLTAALAARPPAAAFFEAFPRSAKRAILEWIGQAKSPETRAKRVIETAEKARENLRANQYRQPKGAVRSRQPRPD